MQSSIALASGMLDAPFTSSAPSATIQVRAAFHAALLEQRRQQHAGPFGAAGHAVRFLNGLRAARRSVPGALDEVQAGDGREALQVVHGEGQRTVHQAVDHQSDAPGDRCPERRSRGRRHVVERGRRDDPDRILKRRRHMKRQPEVIGRRPAAVGVRYAHRGHETGALAVLDQLLAAQDHRRSVLAAPGSPDGRVPVPGSLPTLPT